MSVFKRKAGDIVSLLCGSKHVKRSPDDLVPGEYVQSEVAQENSTTESSDYASVTKAMLEEKKQEALRRRELISTIRTSLPSYHVPNVPGLILIPRFITLAEEATLISQVDSMPWDTNLKRRVQHYGWQYNYKRKSITASSYIGSLPPWCTTLGKRLIRLGLMKREPDQVIVNEYLPGQGISAHVDQPNVFGDEIVSVSLASPVIMRFCLHRNSVSKIEDVVLMRRSAVVLTGEARYKFTHEIAGRTKDKLNGIVQKRERRVSLTFRCLRDASFVDKTKQVKNTG